MPRISAIIGYRNRDKERVINCLESFKSQLFKDFEVVFVDYGSEDSFKDEIKPIVERYNFCNYVYNNTIGMPWNRAHALNTGIKIAKGEYLVFCDIDAIYSDTFLSKMINSVEENTHSYTYVYHLPEGFEDWNALKYKPTNYVHFGKDGKGATHFIKKEYVEQIGGYDEFYCFWGVEDRDLNLRLEKIGLKEKWLEEGIAPVYHQWHPVVSNTKKGFFPEKWWDDMNIYFSLNTDNLIRNNNEWGIILSINDRPTLNTLNKNDLQIDFGDSYEKGRAINTVIQSVKELSNDNILRVVIPKVVEKEESSKDRLLKKLLKKINKLLNKNKFNEIELKKEEIDRDKDFLPEKDIVYLLWRLLKTEKLIKDYYINEDDVNIVVLVSK